MKKITFINPPWYFKHPRDIILSQNLGIGYLCSYLQAQGHKVGAIDALAEGVSNIKKINSRYQGFYQVGLDYKDILGKIPRDSDFIGIAAPFTNNARIAKELSETIKTSLPNIPVVLGGVYPSLVPQDALSASIDYIVQGEGEIALLELLSGKDPTEIKGVSGHFKNNAKLEHAEIIQDLDKLPFPARDKLPMERYLNFHSPHKRRIRSISVITSRGCPFDCNFCSIHLITGRNWRKRSAENVLEEIKLLINKYSIRHIEFEDDNLTLDKSRAMRIFEGIEKLNKNGETLSWSTPNAVRVDSMDRELLEQMKKSNCLSLSFGIESGDPEILKKMNKKIDLEKAAEVIGICKELGIRTTALFIIGYPGETRDSFRKTISFVRKLKTLGVSTFYSTITRAYPGTKLFEECKKNNYIAEDENREDIFLGNAVIQENAVVAPEFNIQTLIKRLHLFEKTTVPFYLRFYHRRYHLIKKIVPNKIIQKIKQLVKYDK